MRGVIIGQVLCAYDAAFTAHTERELQRPVTHFDVVCDDLGPEIIVDTTEVMCDDTSGIFTIFIGDLSFEVVYNFHYLE